MTNDKGPINLEELDLLCDQAPLSDKSSDAPTLALKLKRANPKIAPHLINLAIEVILARRIARDRDLAPDPDRLYATRQSLQQSTHPKIARHHAKRFTDCQNVLEVCGGAGFDTAALSKVARRVTSYEADPILAQFQIANLQRQGIGNVEVHCEAWPNTLKSSMYDGMWADPSRRKPDGSRVSDPEQYYPALSKLLSAKISGIKGIKISPGLNIGLQPDWSREWIGYEDECREQILWSNKQSLVTLVDHSLEWSPIGNQSNEHPTTLIQTQEVKTLVEPQAALIRSGELAQFFSQNQIQLLDPHIAYGGSSSTIKSSPWWTRFSVFESFPYTHADLKRRVASLNWNTRTEIKKRGFPKDPDQVRQELELQPTSKSSDFGVILLTRIGKENIVFLAYRLE